MKFVHIADIHFDCVFSNLNNDIVDKRKLEQRNAFKKVIDYIKSENIDYLFISGDLYENEYIKNSTIEYINNFFKEISKTKIFITPGNHDPNIKGGVYNTFEFANNVKIFTSNEIEKYEDENIEIYGFGFNNFYMNDSPLNNFKLTKNNKFQVLICHADLNGIIDDKGYSYNPISESKLKSIGFDYIALGHIHKNNFNENSKIIYPGSLISLGFDELGEHGMIVGEFNGKNLKLNFEKIDEREFKIVDVDIENINSQTELIEYLTSLYFDSKDLCKVVLKGKRKFIINTKSIMNLIDNSNIVRIKDETVLGYNIDEIAKEDTLRGLYVRKLLNKKDNNLYSTEEIEKAIEIGLEAME